METTLLIMAAGIGSRYGTGIKQLEGIDTKGHLIMDYSIHDAIEAGFNHVVIILREDIRADFDERIGYRIKDICQENHVSIEYAYQNPKDIPGTFPEGRTKPWGTGQAVLAAKQLVTTPFAVINADDYYGKEAFVKLHNWLIEGHEDNEACMAGFILKNTLSDNGVVTRGVCVVDENDYLTDVKETSNIAKTPTGAEVEGVALDPNCYVSMNMWGLSVKFMDVLEENFKVFFEKTVPNNPLKAEYLLPILVGELLEKKAMSVKVLETQDEWFGVTYAADKASVMESFAKLIASGKYTENLFDDLK